MGSVIILDADQTYHLYFSLVAFVNYTQYHMTVFTSSLDQYKSSVTHLDLDKHMQL